MSCALCLSFYGWKIQMNSLMGADISKNNTYATYIYVRWLQFLSSLNFRSLKLKLLNNVKNYAVRQNNNNLAAIIHQDSESEKTQISCNYLNCLYLKSDLISWYFCSLMLFEHLAEKFHVKFQMI